MNPGDLTSEHTMITDISGVLTYTLLGVSPPADAPCGAAGNELAWTKVWRPRSARQRAHTICVALAPGRFVLDERQRSGPVEAEIDPDELVRDAAASCPSEPISLVDADTGQPVDLD